MCEVEKWLRFVTLDGSCIRDGEMLIIHRLEQAKG